MDGMKISLSVPATIYSFGETESLTKNKYVTHAKLKVFYIGQTGDKRTFTKQFSDQLLQSLPGTPVVAYYDLEKDDFVGHNYVQHVFGYVPEKATIEYVTDVINGSQVQFAVTDVLLFTGRPDFIGMVANKIIGKSHSLELDPATVEYNVVRTKMGIESITFTKGHFIGLSVLGDDEKPAFSGSSFFSESKDVKIFIESFKEFKKEVELYKSGGQLMNEENNLPILESEQEVTNASIETVEVVTESEAIVVDATEVEEIPLVAVETVVEEPEEEKDEEEKDEDEDETEMSVVEVETPLETVVLEENIVSSEVVVEAQTLEGMEDVREQKQQQEESQGAQAAYATALNDAERQELNEYRKKAKFELIDSYEDIEIGKREEFKKSHADFTLEELDKELAYELVKSQRQDKKVGVKVFSLIKEPAKPKTTADYINEYKDKK